MKDKKKISVWKILQKIFYICGIIYWLLMASIILYAISLGYTPKIGDYIVMIVSLFGALFYLWALVKGKYFIDC